MGQKRGCPGVPNRYSTRDSSMVTRPKSIATVVVVLSMPGSSRSSWSVAAVIQDSVRMGEISEIAPTLVVFPTPKPPATTIFAEVTSGGWSGAVAKAGTDALQEVQTMIGGRLRG